MKPLSLMKSDNHCFYSFPKEQGFLSKFRLLLEELDIDVFYCFARPNRKDGEPDESKELDISQMTDEHHYFFSEDCWIDLVIGSKKVFVMINSYKDKQQEISGMIMRIFE